MIYTIILSKGETKWLARRFGYTTGFRGNFRWREYHIQGLLTDNWAKMFQVTNYIENVTVFRGNVQIDASDKIVHDMALRTIKRPYRNKSRHIPGKPLDQNYEILLDDEYSF